MYLVDTSVWVDYLVRGDSPQAVFLDSLLDNPLATGITDVVYMEILQGTRDREAFDRMRKYFSGQRFYRFGDAQQSHENAAQIYFNCRRRGIIVRSTVDCLIAQCAIEHDLILFHHDHDFRNMAPEVPALRQKSFL